MGESIFRRRIYDTMLEWKTKRSGRYALLIEGARRVGKSTVVREFASKEFRSCLFIDFNRPKEGTIEIFEKCRSDSSALFMHLQALYGVRLYRGKSVVVFDEVQHYPKARALIKYLVEEGWYSYIETGSLISLRKNVEGIQIPSEEYRIQMNPMTFEEFLWAQGDTVTMELLEEAYRTRTPVGRELHEAVMEKFRTYLLVGGMPQAVAEYISSGDMNEVEVVKESIIRLYRDDMFKIPRGSGIHALEMFEKAPAMLSRHRKVMSPSVLKEGTETDDYAASIAWLAESKICTKCCDSSDPNPAMNIALDRSSYKYYLVDTGLLLTLAFDKGNLAKKDVYEAFLKGRLSMNEGMLFENVVAQMLTGAGMDLHFHEFKVDEDDRHVYEADFLIAMGGKVRPIEVKSSRSNSHRSLDRFMEKYRRVVTDPVVIHPKDLRVDGGILYLPVYMTPFLGS
ncbi:MAG: AAA family ATPase [Thermoplasmata archaeon]|nr:AAA family ATPase [Thermoplasmata archaeon]